MTSTCPSPIVEPRRDRFRAERGKQRRDDAFRLQARRARRCRVRAPAPAARTPARLSPMPRPRERIGEPVGLCRQLAIGEVTPLAGLAEPAQRDAVARAARWRAGPRPRARCSIRARRAGRPAGRGLLPNRSSPAPQRNPPGSAGAESAQDLSLPTARAQRNGSQPTPDPRRVQTTPSLLQFDFPLRALAPRPRFRFRPRTQCSVAFPSGRPARSQISYARSRIRCFVPPALHINLLFSASLPAARPSATPPVGKNRPRDNRHNCVLPRRARFPDRLHEASALGSADMR